MTETCTATTAAGTRCKKPQFLDAKCKTHAGIAQVGRKTKLTPDLLQGMVELQADGVLLKHAAQALGISERAMANWRERGELDEEQGEDTIFAQFVRESSRARAEGIVFHVKNLKRHAPQDWRASSFFLERTDPDSYSRRDKTELTHGGRVEQVSIPSTPERNLEVARILQEAGALESHRETQDEQ